MTLGDTQGCCVAAYPTEANGCAHGCADRWLGRMRRFHCGNFDASVLQCQAACCDILNQYLFTMAKTPAAPANREVGKRLARVRAFRGWRQAQLELLVGLTVQQVANIETGRTPLRFLPGWRLCENLNVNPVWLATGEGRQEPFVDAGLSEAFFEKNADRPFDQVVCELDKQLPSWRMLTAEIAGDELIKLIVAKVRATLESLPVGYRLDYVSCLLNADNEFRKHREKEIASHQFQKAVFSPVGSPIQAPQHPVSIVIPAGGPESKPQKSQERLTTPAFILPSEAEMLNAKALKELTTELRGVLKAQRIPQTRVAKDLGVTRQAVNLWFTKGSLPSYEVGHRLSTWLKRRRAVKPVAEQADKGRARKP